MVGGKKKKTKPADSERRQRVRRASSSGRELA